VYVAGLLFGFGGVCVGGLEGDGGGVVGWRLVVDSFTLWRRGLKNVSLACEVVISIA
jgi:hypothetical protein